MFYRTHVIMFDFSDIYSNGRFALVGFGKRHFPDFA